MRVTRSGFKIDFSGRECSRCGVFKPWDMYWLNSQGVSGRMSACISCMLQDSTGGLVNDVGRECSSCKKFKPWSEFGKNINGLHGKRNRCKECSRILDKKRKLRERLRVYGLSIDEYDELLAKQNNSCAICGDKEKSVDGRVLAVDHDHVTGKVRGLLCVKCNTILGQCNDDTQVLFRAIKYLSKGK